MNPDISGTSSQKRVRSWPNAPWVEAELQKFASPLAPGEVIAEVGVGAGSYARALLAPAAVRLTLDLPVEQVSRPWQWPIASGSVDLFLSIDALHYEADVEVFVQEVARVTRPGKTSILLARSRENLQEDGLAHFFPPAVERALPLLTELPVLLKLLEKAGLYSAEQKQLTGKLSIDETLLRAIAHRELTGLGALSDAEFESGVAKLKVAVASGNTSWPAHYTMIVSHKRV